MAFLADVKPSSSISTLPREYVLSATAYVEAAAECLYDTLCDETSTRSEIRESAARVESAVRALSSKIGAPPEKLWSIVNGVLGQ